MVGLVTVSITPAGDLRNRDRIVRQLRRTRRRTVIGERTCAAPPPATRAVQRNSRTAQEPVPTANAARTPVGPSLKALMTLPNLAQSRRPTLELNRPGLGGGSGTREFCVCGRDGCHRMWSAMLSASAMLSHKEPAISVSCGGECPRDTAAAALRCAAMADSRVRVDRRRRFDDRRRVPGRYLL